MLPIHEKLVVQPKKYLQSLVITQQTPTYSWIGKYCVHYIVASTTFN